MAKPLSKGKTGANAIGFVVLTIAALGAANFVGTRFFKRLDMTSEKVYAVARQQRPRQEPAGPPERQALHERRPQTAV